MVIQTIATEQAMIQEKVEENGNNEEEIIENINVKEDEETRIMRLRFEEILHVLTASKKENIEDTAAVETEKKDFFFNWYSLHARLNSHYEAWSYKKKKHKKVKAYRKFI